MCKLILLYCRLAVPTLHRASYNWPALRVLVLRLTPLCINRTFRVLEYDCLISKRSLLHSRRYVGKSIRPKSEILSTANH